MSSKEKVPTFTNTSREESIPRDQPVQQKPIIITRTPEKSDYKSLNESMAFEERILHGEFVNTFSLA